MSAFLYRYFFTLSLKPALFLVISAGVVIILYSLGWAGGWHFDDATNLGGLLAVFGSGQISWSAALEFVFSGDAGPLGRPISLASFLIDGSTWPASPRAMLYTNSLLHIINGLLLCGLWLAVLRQRNGMRAQSQWVAVGACLLWLFQPLLVSGVLMAVQRMMLLSSTFMLLGAWLYVLGREHLEDRPVMGWLLMLGGLGGGTVFGVFSKEQAALLPLLLWVLDRCLLNPPQLTGKQQRLWILFRILAFYLPSLIIAAYLLRTLPNADVIYASRDFTLSERLWTQSVILWDYLRLALLPRAFEFGPFHDDYRIYTAELASLIATVAWLVLFIVCWLLRRKTVWPLFALLWFIVAHLVESSVVALELYFEHRNYLAIAGPLLALVAMVAQWAGCDAVKQRLAASVLALYGLLLAFVLSQVTSLFGQNAVAARIWYEQHPQSVRAAQYLAGGLSERGDFIGALQILDKAAAIQQKHKAGLSLQGLQLACVLEYPREELADRLQTVLVEVRQVEKRFAINDSLEKLKNLHDRKACDGFLSQDMLVEIAEGALTSKGFSGLAMGRSNLNYFLATIYLDKRNLDRTMYHLEAAMQAVPQLVTLQLMVNVLKSAELHKEALQLMDDYPVAWSKSPILRKKQQAQWQEMYLSLQ